MPSFSALVRLRHLLLRPALLRRPFCSPPCAELTAAADPSPTSKPAYELVMDVLRERDLSKLADKFLSFSAASSRFRCNRRVYDLTFRRLSAAGRQSSIEAILDAHRKIPDISKEGFAVRLISLCGKIGMYDYARKLFDELPQLNCPRTIWSFNALLAAAADSGLHETVGEIFNKLAEELSLTPNVVSYNVLIETYCKMGSLDEAVGAVFAMEAEGLTPSVVTFNTVLNYLYAKEKVSDADRLWVKMEELSVSPDTRTYNTKLRWLVSCGKTVEAVELVSQLGDSGLKPDTYSFNALINGYCKDGNLEEAKKVFDNLKDNGCVPNRWSFEVLIGTLCEKGDIDLAFEMSKECMTNRHYVGSKVLQGVLDKLVEESKMDEAKELVALGWSSAYYRNKLVLPPTKKD